MKTLGVVALIPLGILASILRPCLTFMAVGMLISGGWAYVNPGLADPVFAKKVLLISLVCYSARFACDLLQSFIERNIV